MVAVSWFGSVLLNNNLSHWWFKQRIVEEKKKGFSKIKLILKKLTETCSGHRNEAKRLTINENILFNLLNWAPIFFFFDLF